MSYWETTPPHICTMAQVRRALATCAVLTAARNSLPQIQVFAAPRMESKLAEHNQYQAKTFDEKSDFFASEKATPASVEPKLRRIACSCRLETPGTTLLDVGTGTGALLPFFQEAGVDLAQVVGVDLSAGMLGFAKERFPETTFVQEDVLQFQGGRFDRVVFNACFGNLFDPVAVLRHVARDLLSDGGLVVISHPLGRPWLRTLQQSDPRMVLHDLPGKEQLKTMLAEVPELELESLEDDADFYCLVLRRR
ncbi:unnamed protein product [Effrenium voratum]|uniref:Methyltransferase domain-containing protein n=1 Tax=Effrenium voratum TaxID=2562239 RepID=A0AA36NMT0_9DINO|nr:unnamed protein product [Effrenium voratum]CAJ1410078.1 unnamed protein product [Effrenium voratum]